MSSSNSTSWTGYLALVGILAAGAVIWLTIEADNLPKWAEIGLIVIGLAVACGAIGAAVKLLGSGSK
ncbi:hypothetical protein [Yimella sp. NH-Cas1]|uniref:hypothetical protein n=1 Tax=Yimella sp. NH-Cas1 TaxID=2917726 RepID=UPI001EFAC305|nr:hypothetical protein [Yimella sp. NH-Cas1]MCG8654521.1 hypothetical protein [Yimella sp. NH-Cas1]